MLESVIMPESRPESPPVVPVSGLTIPVSVPPSVPPSVGGDDEDEQLHPATVPDTATKRPAPATAHTKLWILAIGRCCQA